MVATEESKLTTTVAVTAIFRDAVSGPGTGGLGPNMSALLAKPAVAFAINWTANKRRFAEEEQRMKDASDAKKAPRSGAKSKGADQPPQASTKAIVEQDIYGERPVEANVALLHVGGDHYVALVRR